MDKDSEVTADNYRPEDMKFRKKYIHIIEKKEMGVEEVWDKFKKKYNSKVPIYNKFLYTLFVFTFI